MSPLAEIPGLSGNGVLLSLLGLGPKVWGPSRETPAPVDLQRFESEGRDAMTIRKPKPLKLR